MTFDGTDLLKLTPRRAPQDRRQGHGDDLPGADGQPQSLLHRRLPDRGSAARPYGHGPQASAAPAPSSCSKLVGIPEPAERLGSLSAPDVGRPVPARHDRHCDRLQSEAADRRRADHRARRDHPEADPRPADAAAGRARHGADHDHPQYGRGRRDGRPRHRPVQGPQDGGGRRAVAVRDRRRATTRARCCRRCRKMRPATGCRPSPTS